MTRMGRSAALAAIAILACARSALAGPVTRVLASDDEGVRLEIIVPEAALETLAVEGETFTRVRLLGGVPARAAGEPEVSSLPIWVGIPAGASPTVRVVESASRTIPGALLYPAPRDTVIDADGIATSLGLFAWDRAAYGSGGVVPASQGRISSVGRMRHQTIATVDLAAVRFRPAAREIEIATRFVVDVRWERPAAGKESELREAPREPDWEQAYRGLLANPDQAAGLRSRPRASRVGRGPRKAGARPEGPEWKLSVLESGLYRIPFESLRDEGFPAGVADSTIRIFQRSVSDTLLFLGEDPFRAVEIPIEVVDAAGDGVFGEGDAVHVFLRDFREQFMRRDYEDMFTTRAVYWLAQTPGEAGARVASRGGWLGLTGLAPQRSFVAKVRVEPDAVFNDGSPRGDYDLWFATEMNDESRSFGVALQDVDAERPFRFRASALGRTNVNVPNDSPSRMSFSINGTPFASFSFAGRIRVVYAPDSVFAGSLIASGANTLQFRGRRGDPENIGAGAYLDWMEIDHGRFYRANGNRLSFTAGEPSSPVEIHIPAFASDAIYLYDVTQPLAPQRVLADSIAGGPGAYELRFQVAAGAPRRFEAATASGARTFPDSLLRRSQPADLAGEEADYLMIAYDEFAPALAPLVAHREGQGMRVQVALLSDVYDLFGAGTPGPDAIRRYAKYASVFWDRPPSFLLLAGDAHEDHVDRSPFYGTDYLPALPIYQPDPFGIGDHWDACDNWYALLDNTPATATEVQGYAPMGTDGFVDIFLGRLSVRSASELSVQVEKTVAYEAGAQGSDAWRRRYLLVCDDSWITHSGTLYADAGQIQFETTSIAHYARIDTSSTLDLDPILMRETDVLTNSLRLSCDPDSNLANGMPLVGFNRRGNQCTIDSIRAQMTPVLIDRLNEGVLFASYQGHGNRYVLSHETLLLDGQNHIDLVGIDDTKRLLPTGRPFVFMGYGCSISEFDKMRFNDDCIMEDMMQVADGGAVATFGSSGVEFLEPNLVLNNFVLDALLSGSSGNPPRFLLGEITGLGMGKYASGPGGDRGSMLRYVLFGDPALRLRTVPASYQVTVDGRPVEDGAFLTAQNDTTPIRIVARSSDPSVLRGLRIERSGVGTIDTTLYPVTGDSVVYVHTIDFLESGSYELAIRAPAFGGGDRVVRLRVDLQTTFTFGGREVPDGGLIDPAAPIRVVLTVPLRVAREEIGLALDGVPLDAVPDSTGPQSWRIDVPVLALSDGSHELTLSVRGFTKTQRFAVKNAFAVLDPLCFPNPVNPDIDRQTTFSFRLSADADEVVISIYTVNGRKIREIEGLSGRAGFNPSGGFWDGVWDGRDEDGDSVANGVYLYRVRARSGDQSAEAIGKLVILRREPAFPETSGR